MTYEAIAAVASQPSIKCAGLKKWIVGHAQMTLADIECVCKTFSELEELVCVSLPTVMSNSDDNNVGIHYGRDRIC